MYVSQEVTALLALDCECFRARRFQPRSIFAAGFSFTCFRLLPLRIMSMLCFSPGCSSITCGAFNVLML